MGLVIKEGGECLESDNEEDTSPTSRPLVIDVLSIYHIRRKTAHLKGFQGELRP